MGKKSAQQVAKAVSVTPPTKSAKKGKRNAGETIEKLVSAKKQKIAEEVLLKKQNRNVITKKKKEASSSEGISSESEEEIEAKVNKLPAAKAKNGHALVSKKKDESSDGSDSDISSDEDDPTNAPKEGSISEDGSSEEESEDEEPAKTPNNNLSTKASKESNSSEDSSDEEESEEEQPAKTPKNNHITPAAPNVQTTGSKTLFVGNLSFSIERTDVEEFFKDAGEVVDVRFSSNNEGKFRGYGHVEFATEGEAKKALELNGQDLLGRPVKLDIARERGSNTPQSSKESNSYQKGGKGQARTIFVRGFDTSTGEDEIRSTLEEHFESCGEISRVSIPKDYETGGPKGIAYIDFPNEDSFSKALELNGCDLGGCSLVVEEAKPRADNRDGGGSGRGGRGSGRGGRGRSGGRDSGGRFGGRRGGGGRGGRFGGGGRGRGTNGSG
ncbi:nucleolin 2-like [Telopea speciosissima]|uniref:nucleolin 2-like n=1 Tax=Telopea speciosissima TaxID=54955 RepID=UPI001CC38DC2|nr:nucleolin 2-like [Telopea speciosissima]